MCIAAKEVIDLCDAHQSLSAARSGDVGAALLGTGVEGMDKLAVAASALREAVVVLQRYSGVDEWGRSEMSAGEPAGVDVAAAGRKALKAVKDLAGLLASEVRKIASCFAERY